MSSNLLLMFRGVLRGGSWHTAPFYNYNIVRYNSSRFSCYLTYGFRLVGGLYE
jgi:hypothetical protein